MEHKAQKILKVIRLIQLLSEKVRSAKKLSEILDVSLPTLYRYIDLVKEIGYHISSEDHKYSIEVKSEKSFTSEEKKLISSAMKSLEHHGELAISISKKLRIDENLIDPISLSIVYRLKLVGIIQHALASKKDINIKRYESTSGNIVPERKVRPIYYDEEKMALFGYEINSNALKVYKVLRMNDVDVIDTIDSITEIEASKFYFDPFGFIGEEVHTVELKMTLRAKTLLVEDFPTCLSDISRTEDPILPFNLKVKVCNYTGIGRFVLGMMSEVTIIGNQEFKSYIHERIKNNILF